MTKNRDRVKLNTPRGPRLFWLVFYFASTCVKSSIDLHILQCVCVQVILAAEGAFRMKHLDAIARQTAETKRNQEREREREREREEEAWATSGPSGLGLC